MSRCLSGSLSIPIACKQQWHPDSDSRSPAWAMQLHSASDKGSSIHVCCLKQPSVTIEWLDDLVWTRESTVAFPPEWRVEWKWCLFSFGLNRKDGGKRGKLSWGRRGPKQNYITMLFSRHTQHSLTYKTTQITYRRQADVWYSCSLPSDADDIKPCLRGDDPLR